MSPSLFLAREWPAPGCRTATCSAYQGCVTTNSSISSSDRPPALNSCGNFKRLHFARLLPVIGHPEEREQPARGLERYSQMTTPSSLVIRLLGPFVEIDRCWPTGLPPCVDRRRATGVNCARFAGGSNCREGGACMSKRTNKFAPEVRASAMRIVFEHERDRPSRWAAVVSIAEKIGCVPQTLHEWVKKAEVNSGKGAGVPAEVADMVKASFLICHVMGSVLLRHSRGSGAGKRRPASRYYRGNWRSHFTFNPFFKLVSTGKA